MNSCKNFSKKHPILLAALTFVFMIGLLRLMRLVPEGPMALGIREIIMAVIVYIVTFLFLGKEKVRFSTEGFGYAFVVLRSYYILLAIITTFCIVATILENVLIKAGSLYQPIAFINILLVCLFVGIVEEFTFRGLIFGSLLQKMGSDKKSIILAAVISGFLFGVMHILGSAIAGEITTMGAVITASFKILQCAIFGVVLAFIYYKTNNLFLVALLHSLDDFMIFVAGVGNSDVADYVVNTNIVPYIVVYTIFTLILVPSLVTCIRDVSSVMGSVPLSRS